jgi:hypothetical protein
MQMTVKARKKMKAVSGEEEKTVHGGEYRARYSPLMKGLFFIFL